MEISANMNPGFILYSNILFLLSEQVPGMCVYFSINLSRIMTEDGIFAKSQAKCTFFHAITPLKEHLHGSKLSFAIEINCYLMFEQVSCIRVCFSIS